MSIAVMNWVSANSPTSGNERLALLALADACSRDDGTGYWPSAATIARKANISDATVRRVIARLEADGHVIVHRGGGRAGSTNSYTVVAGDRVTHSPGQNVTPDRLSGGDGGDTPPPTQLRQGTPDAAMSADPPVNHKGTATAHARDACAGGSPAPNGQAAEVGEFFDALAALCPRRELATGPRKRLAPVVASGLAQGWAPGAVAECVSVNTSGIRNPAAVPAARLSPTELPPPAPQRRPPWCGQCDQATRMLDFDGDAPRPCPHCKAPRSAFAEALARFGAANLPAVRGTQAPAGLMSSYDGDLGFWS
jgi:hypothetical protein